MRLVQITPDLWVDADRVAAVHEVPVPALDVRADRYVDTDATQTVLYLDSRADTGKRWTITGPAADVVARLTGSTAP